MTTLTQNERQALLQCLPGHNHTMTRLNDLYTKTFRLARVYCRTCGAFMTIGKERLAEA